MFISFIVPCYNVEKYVETCIDSLLHQDIAKEDYEIICINDGSTDDTLSVLRRYGKAYQAVSVIDQKNAGVCTARNAGLEKAFGDYIWFVDADDCIQPNCLAALRLALYAEDADRMIISNYSFPDGEDPYSGTERWKVNTIWEDSSACRSVFKRNFLRQRNLEFHYPELTYGEDALFMYEVKAEKPHVVSYSFPLYYYRSRKHSASTGEEIDSVLRILESNIREASIMKDYFDHGRTDAMTADRLMSFLYGALYRIAGFPIKMANVYLLQLKNEGLFPYKRPTACTITKSYQLNRNDWVEKVHDWIYIRMNTYWGYFAMRCWNKAFQIKGKVVHK